MWRVCICLSCNGFTLEIPIQRVLQIAHACNDMHFSSNFWLLVSDNPVKFLSKTLFFSTWLLFHKNPGFTLDFLLKSGFLNGFKTYKKLPIHNFWSSDYNLLVQKAPVRLKILNFRLFRIFYNTPNLTFQIDNVYCCLNTWRVCRREMLRDTRLSGLLRSTGVKKHTSDKYFCLMTTKIYAVKWMR